MLQIEFSQQMILLLLLTLTVVALLAALVGLYLQNRSAVALKKRSSQLEHDLQMLSGSAIGLGKRLVSIEHQLKTQQTVVPEVAPTPPVAPAAPINTHNLSDNGGAGYAEAVRLLDSGLAADEVARRCGLSKSEVSLMQLMSGHQSAQEKIV